MHDDDELATKAFSRSQANDPENAVAWLGQAILAVRANDSIEAHELYQHAFEIGERSFVRAAMNIFLFRLLLVIDLPRPFLIKSLQSRFIRFHFLRRLCMLCGHFLFGIPTIFMLCIF
jgi:hypothetical protein